MKSSLPLLVIGSCLAALALAGSASGQAPAVAGKTGGIGSSKEPVDISADTNEVFQNEHRVVYRGQVEALQGVQRLRTPELTLYFTPREGAPKAATGGLGSGFGSISRMEATGPVYLVTPTQSAKGDHGTYEAVSDTMVLTGNVVLLQDKNVVRGDRLVIDQKSGHATITSGARTRVRGVFYPSEQAQTAPGAAPAR
ncbi:LptA/OstA family protein [soil metagenome]